MKRRTMLSHLDTEPVVRGVVDRNLHRGYLRCDECGAEPDSPCMDLDNTPAVEVCDGRRMVDAVDDDDRSVVRKKLGVRAPCRHCGELTLASLSKGLAGDAWCMSEECRTAKDAHDARERAKSARPESLRGALTCVVCGAPRGGASRAYCGERCSRIAAHRVEAERRKQRREAEAALPRCAWCAATLSRSGRGDRPACCGSRPCKNARAREWAARQRSRAITPDPA